MVISQDRKNLVTEPSGQAEHMDIDELMPMGDLAQREAPPGIEERFSHFSLTDCLICDNLSPFRM